MPCRRLSTSSLFLVLAGCTQTGAPAGTILGTVTFNGAPAPGKVVELLCLASSGDSWESVARVNGKYAVSTDVTGTYTFASLKTGTYRVQYLSDPMYDSLGKIIGPNEVASWRSSAVRLSGVGAVVPSFDVAYNGLLYPDTEKKSLPSANNPLPFVWSTHTQALRYQVSIWSLGSAGVINATGSPQWQSDWTQSPTLSYTGTPGSGNYGWEVTIDGGAAGQGKSRVRSLLF